MESPFQSLVKCYIHGIIRQAQGTLNPYEMLQFYECRKAIKRGLQTFEWMLMGFDGHVVNVLMQMGDRFLRDGNVQMAMAFYHEASHMFPHAGICYIRETQCHVVLKCFDQAKKACRKAIRHSDDSDFNQLYSIIDMFIENNRLQEAHDLYIILMDKFPHHYQVLQIVQELKILLRDKAEESKKEIRNKKKKNVSKGPASGIKKTTSKNIGQTSKEKLGEASGGTDPSDTVDIAQNAASAKVVKSSKQLKREQMAREKEIEREIEKARKEQEEERKKQEEVEARKRKEREEEEEKLRKQEEVEARKRKEREEHEKKLEKQRNDEIKKQQGGTNKRVGKKSSKTSNGIKAMDTHATRSKNSSTNTALPKKLSLNDMSTDFDLTLKSGSQLRRVCSTCNTPRAFSYNQRNCHSCRSEFVVWYKRVTTTSWVRPRMPPNQDIAGRYVQCKHFLQGKPCVKTPCAFAHGEDELEIWELCRVKKARQQAPHSRNEGFQERKTSVSSLPNSWSCRTVNGHDSGTGRRSRTESLSSHRSQSSSNTFDLLSTEDTMLDDFDSDSEYSSYFSQDGFDELSQDSAGRSTSSLSLNVDMDGLGPKAEAQTTPVEPDQSDDGWIEVGKRKKPQRIVSEEFNRENRGKNKKKKKKASSSATTTSSQSFDTTVLLVKEQEKLRCEFCKITFSSMLQLEYHYSDPQHRVNVMKKIQQFNAKSYTKFRPPPDGVYMGRYKLCRRFEQGYCYFGNKCTFAHGDEECTYWKASYQLQAQQLAQFQEKRLLTENFSENVWRRMKHEGEHHVLKENLPGVTVNCNSPLRMRLDGPQDHMWIFDVRIQTKYRVLLRQVAFLLETHLDKFKFFRNPRENCSSNMQNTQSVQLLEEDFVENFAKQESAVQFCVQFSSHVFGDFQQKLVFDFGDGSVLARSLYVSVVSKDICSSKEEPSTRTTYCRILEWSVEKMELILCKDLKGLNLNSLCEQYNIPKDLPADPAESVEFTRETYCKVWHDLLFIEEQHIQMEVARYDIQNGAMKIVNSFQSVNETIFARPGELFGEIYLSDYLVMDEVAGHLINRSVMSVILRPKVKHSQSNRVYECSIKLKTSQSVIIKLNEVLCKDYVFQRDQVIYIDIKFRYNRLPMCEMHQAIDMCKEKTKVLLPNVKNVSYTDKKSIHDWFMDRKPNTNQHEAIAMILDPSPTPPILVIGPFGTGKTFTLSLACVSILSQPERKKVNKVLICTHSNSAATIHLQHLDEKIAKKPLLNIRPLRVYNLLRNVWTIPEKLRKYCLIEETTNVIKEPSWNEIRDHNVIITTLATARMLWKFYQDGRLRFTHILIDEAAQALEPECVTPLVMADGNTKIVLAGDHKQMGPQVYSKCLRAEDVGPKRSLLERLFTHYKQCDKTSSQPSFTLDYKNTFLHTPYLVLLTENYRCHAKILDFPSDCFYGGKLVAKGDQSTHELVPVLSFYAAQGVDNRDEGSLAYYNDAEVAEVVKRVEELDHLWPKDWSKSIGVLTPYRDQVRRIRDGLRKRGLGYVDVETVENVQGKEFKALFISTVRTMWTCSQIEGRNIDEDPSELDFAFLSDPRFLNTAVTRSQSLLAVVGDPMSLCSVGACRNLWKEYLQRCDANKGLYGCTLKTVMDFCLRSQTLDPSAHEFTPNKNVQDENDETLTTTSSKGAPKASSEENSIGIETGSSSSKASETELSNGFASISHGPSSTAITNQTIQPVSSAVVSGQDSGRIEGIQVDRETDLTEDNQSNRNENVSDKDENKDEDDSEMNEAATDDFFHRDGIDDNFDKIIEELIKACQETREKDEACQETKKKDGGRQQNVTVEDFPSLTDVPQAPSTPRWSNVSINRTFSAGFKDGRIELGFHVKDSERFVRLTGGKLSLKENGDNQSGHDIDAVPQEELLKLLKGSPTLFTKCSFHIDTASRQLGYCGQLPTPDSPDIHIPGRVRRVYEDDVVVLELRPSARARDEIEQKQEVKIFGYIKGVLRRLIEPEERQFVCTVDRASPGVMIPINKNSPKLMNFTKTDEKNIIPIYIMKDKEVSRATILSKKHYGEALAGERVFVVKYLKWRPDCPYPLGLAIRHIPHGRDFKTGMEILYEEYNIKREFDKKLRKSVERQFSENWQVPVSEKGRPVYRDNVFTIDPPESLDLDDAISIRSLGNGNYELHIHIADVSYFVQPNTALDEEARLRGTSYYPPKPKETVPMPKETVPMLPRELSENCCSLLKGKDRLALTLSVEVMPDGTDVGDARIERSVVRSRSRLTYLQAQKFIDESSQTEVPINGEAKQIPVEEAIGVVHRMAQERRRSRLGLGRSLYERKRDDSDDDDENEREAHQMIEEIMVMANHLVAKYLLKKFPKCTPLRVQPPPKARRVVEWRQRFQKFVNFSLGLEWLGGDQETAQEEKIKLKVPFTTWSKIINQVRQNSNFEELVKLVCDLDLFPQLALANVHQQLLQQRGQYMCSGETFENIRFPWLQDDKETPTDKQKVHADVSSNSPIEIASLPEDNESISEDTTDQETNSGEIETDATDDLPVSSSASVNEGVQSSADVSNQQELNKILYGHYSLCLDAYCHFTSPIRRYIDIIVHRLVVASIENRPNFMDSDDITILCDRCTFFARNSRRFDKNAKKLRLAVNSQSSMRFVSAFIDEIAPDALKLFFGTGEFELLRGKSVRIARLGPDKDPEGVDDHIKLQWTFRFLRLDRQGRAQPKLYISDDEESQDLAKDEDPTDSSEVSDDDFDFTVSSENWNGVLEAVKNQDEDELKSRLQEVDDDLQKQEKPESSTKISLVKKLKTDPSLSSNEPYQHPNTGKPQPSEKETDEFLKVVKSFKPYDRVKVQICSQMTRGILSPAIQLFKLTDKLHACIEHRSFPTTCFAKTSYKRPTNTEVSDITEYVKLWKPVLMMEIATSAVRENDVITLSNLRVSFAQDSKGLVTMEFNLSNAYIRDHVLDPLDLNLMCVRVKDPDGSGKDTGYWVGHFQISEELRKKEDARKILEEAEKNAKKDEAVQPDEAGLNSSTPVAEVQDTKKAKKKENKNTSSKKEQDDRPTLTGLNPPAPVPGFQHAKKINSETKTRPKKEQFRAVLARRIHSSTPVPESLITQRYCYVTVELLMLNISDRRRLGALVDSVIASELVQNICIGEFSTELEVEGELPKNLSLCNVHPTLQDFYPLNDYQRNAVQEALTKSFTLIQGPPGTGKTVTGVHIAYWFAQLNQKRIPTVEKEGEACNGSMVFYCGPSNKSVDVVARYLMKIPGLKILRIYGQEIERKVFPVPDKVTLFRSKRVAVQLKADEDLKDVSLHHVIRSAECPLAKTLKTYDEKFKAYTGHNPNAPRKMVDEFNKVKSEAEEWAITQRGVNVILATCTTAYSHRILAPCEGFVCQCIIDECGMCIEAETLCAMLGSNAKQVVLIGDHKQLQPVIQCDKAKDLGLGISMFERFSERAQMLEIQYRMHQELCQFPSEFFYDGKLKTAKQVLDRRPDNVKWPNGDRYPFVFHHVEGIEESLIVATDQGNENSKKNQKEIEKVVYVARRLINHEGITGDDIVILSPYRAQCFEITEKLKQHGLDNISVMSVVAAQGSEKNYVILSLVRSVPEREIERNPSRSWLMEHLGFLTDEHQINVALTRAKRGLCIVGNANLIGICSMWRALLKHYENKGCLKMTLHK